MLLVWISEQIIGWQAWFKTRAYAGSKKPSINLKTVGWWYFNYGFENKDLLQAISVQCCGI